ncbi:uncharacterized protein LOC107636669 [Arachis ipaensis]|uniref:uncharacterized protein LOC107636669 n=1 Tax=Arachis ipaensis TaxID=130454 RepID=UPI000A2B9201|nr:uncharacterized protein LOC107636669 [Arachis ipaensis]
MEQIARFLAILRKLKANSSYAEALEKKPPTMAYLQRDANVVLTKECSTLVQKKHPQKLPDPGSFLIPCTIGTITFEKALCDLCSSINLIPLFVMKRLGIQDVKPTKISLEMEDKSLKKAYGIVEDVLVKVEDLYFPANFLILDNKEDRDDSIILGRPFLATDKALIDVERGELVLSTKLYRSPNINSKFSVGHPSSTIGEGVNVILSLEHVDLIHENTGRKFTMRGEDLIPYQPP